jgi:hypothetical protein
VLASEGRQRYIYTKTHKNIKEKKILEGVYDWGGWKGEKPVSALLILYIEYCCNPGTGWREADL